MRAYKTKVHECDNQPERTESDLTFSTGDVVRIQYTYKKRFGVVIDPDVDYGGVLNLLILEGTDLVKYHARWLIKNPKY